MAQSATGVPVIVSHETVSLSASVRIPWEAEEMPPTPITFAVMPGNDDVVLFGI